MCRPVPLSSPVTVGKLLSLALGLLGFAIRCVISYNVLWVLYFFCWGAYYWIIADPTPPDPMPLGHLLFGLLLGGMLLSKPLMGMTDQAYLQLLGLFFAAASSVMAILWGRVCRRRCWPAMDRIRRRVLFSRLAR